MTTITITRLAGLEVNDRLLSWDDRPYRRPLRVTDALAPIAPGSPVEGVRVDSPNPASGVEWVFYPGQMDGKPMEVERI